MSKVIVNGVQEEPVPKIKILDYFNEKEVNEAILRKQKEIKVTKKSVDEKKDKEKNSL